MSIRNRILAVLGVVVLVGGAFLLGGQLIGKTAETSTAAETQVNRPYLGISSIDVTSSLATNLGLKINQGVYVVRVDPNSPAAKAGLEAGSQTGSGPGAAPGKIGDVITAVDNTQIVNTDALTSLLGTKKVGDSVSITVLRSGQPLKLNAVLAAWPATNGIVSPVQPVVPAEHHMSWHINAWAKMLFGVLVGLVLGGLILAITKPFNKRGLSASRALEIARERYARGEVSSQEFEQLKKELT